MPSSFDGHSGASAQSLHGSQEHEDTGASVFTVRTHGRGRGEVFREHALLRRLGERYRQLDTLQDLAYFVEKPGLMRRIPHLLLLQRAGLPLRNDGAEHLTGALILHEFRPFGIPSRTFAVSDRSGRGVVIGSAEDRLPIALASTRRLFARGAKLVLLTMQCKATAAAAAAVMVRSGFSGVDWSLRSRMSPTFLPLKPTLDETLRTLGQKTRANLRYYRKRAEEDLQCRFEPEAKITETELISFNRACMFPQPRDVVRWRLDLQHQLQDPYLMSLRDGTGGLLSLVGGRRFSTASEILWQMNLGGMPRQSIVSAMRSYVMEHEIARGAAQFYIEGGTPHSMQNSFAQEELTDLIFVRPWLRRPVSEFARRYVPTDNVLAEMLNDPTIHWHRA